ncbi:MAG: response regulator [Candidatus Brocadiales bacterium]|nr:response regulator [Candidatus Brocadiales bacterium]
MKKKVIIVIAEDDAGHAKLIKKNIRRAGFYNEIKHFTDGEQTLDYFLGDKSDISSHDHVLLLDIRMPKIDGITVLSKLRQNLQQIKIPVIIITTTDDPHEIKKCYKLGCNSYLVKPIEYGNFVEAFNQTGLFPTSANKEASKKANT